MLAKKRAEEKAQKEAQEAKRKAEEAAKASGATVQKSVTKKTDILVCGIGVGQNKMGQV